MTTHATHRRGPGTERDGLTHKVSIGRLPGFVTVNEDDEGRPIEVFLHGFGDFGSTLQGYCDTFAIMLSLGLQHGLTLEALADKFSRKRIEPYGKTSNPEIPYAWSIPDYVVYWLVRRYGSDALREQVDIEREVRDET